VSERSRWTLYLVASMLRRKADSSAGSSSTTPASYLRMTDVGSTSVEVQEKMGAEKDLSGMTPNRSSNHTSKNTGDRPLRQSSAFGTNSSSSMGFKSHLELGEQMGAANLRAQRTIGCYLTYVIMIWLAIFVILWEISLDHRRPNHWLHIVMELTISVFLLGEIFVFFIAMGSRYFQRWIHVADLVVTIGCALLFLGLIVDEMVESFEWPEEFELSILLIRYGLMACRLACLCYRSGRAEKIRMASNVRFSNVESDDPSPTQRQPLLPKPQLSQNASNNPEDTPGWIVSMTHPAATAKSGFWR